MDQNKISTYATFLCLLYIVVSVFSIAGQSILMGVMLIASVGRLFYDIDAIKSNGEKQDFIWLVIPIVYLFTLFYCRDFYRGWNQWLNMAPLTVLSIYFFVFKNQLKRSILVQGILIATGMSMLCHVLFPIFKWSAWVIEELPWSFFHSREQNSWILWSASLVGVVFIKRPVLRFVFFILIEIAFLYFGSARFAIFILLFYSVTVAAEGHSIRNLVVQCALSLPLICIISYVLFTAFHDTILSFSGYVISYSNEISFSWNQMLKHPLTGVGLGDYIHAMWNEYNDHNLPSPDKPNFQFLHLMVSTGVLSFIPVYWIWKNNLTERNPVFTITIFMLLGLLFFAPFTSQVSCSAFILPFLVIRLKEFL